LRFGELAAIILLNIVCIPLLSISSLLQCPWFTGLVFWWSCWVLSYSFCSSWVFCLRLLFFFNIYFIFEPWGSVFLLF
jgi:hypothetical protein